MTLSWRIIRPGADVALAEFNALRAEMMSHSGAQGALMALVITAIGVIAGFVVKEGGSDRLLLVLPFLVAAVGIYYSEHTRRMGVLGEYIREELWPYLAPPSGIEGDCDLRFPSWERTLGDYRRRERPMWSPDYWSFMLLSGLPGGLIFGLGSAVPLAVLPFLEEGLDKPFDWLVWSFGVLLTALYAWLAWKASRALVPNRPTHDDAG